VGLSIVTLIRQYKLIQPPVQGVAVLMIVAVPP